MIRKWIQLYLFWVDLGSDDSELDRTSPPWKDQGLSDNELNNTGHLWTDLGIGDLELDRTSPPLTDLDLNNSKWKELVVLGKILTNKTQLWIDLDKP